MDTVGYQTQDNYTQSKNIYFTNPMFMLNNYNYLGFTSPNNQLYNANFINSAFNTSLNFNTYGSLQNTFLNFNKLNYASNNCNIFNYNLSNNYIGFPHLTFGNTGSSRTSNIFHKSSNTILEFNGNVVPDGTSTVVEGIDYSVFGRANENKVKLMRPEMQAKLEKLFIYAKSKGWNLSITSAFRSVAEQKKLYDQWLSGKKKCQVAAPGHSRHNFGCAVDLCIDGVGGNNNPKLKELGRYAQTIGLRWGGNNFNEDWHFDLDPSKTQKSTDGKIIAKKGSANSSSSLYATV